MSFVLHACLFLSFFLRLMMQVFCLYFLLFHCRLIRSIAPQAEALIDSTQPLYGHCCSNVAFSVSVLVWRLLFLRSKVQCTDLFSPFSALMDTGNSPFLFFFPLFHSFTLILSHSHSLSLSLSLSLLFLVALTLCGKQHT